jgi:transcriptional/translational regulatory protein YebC/TACO1
MEIALDAGAEDIVEDGDDWIVYTATDQLFQVNGVLREKGLTSRSQKLIYQPQTTVTISDVETAKSLIRLYDILDDYDDANNIHANFEIDDSIADQLD